MSRSIYRVLALVSVFTLIGVSAATAAAPDQKQAGGGARVLRYDKPDGASYYAVSLAPKIKVTASKGHDVVVLFETSASQAGPHREAALQALRGLISNLGRNDRVRLLAYDLDANPMTTAAGAPGSDVLREAVHRLNRRTPLGTSSTLACA